MVQGRNIKGMTAGTRGAPDTGTEPEVTRKRAMRQVFETRPLDQAIK